MCRYSEPPSGRGPPDLVCLSYTHDDDFTDYKPWPAGKKPRSELRAG